ncbi:hypothetical protein [Ruminococcus sp.]|uniref:hypothetical protein n=1 Tax=Ruminococcus sp. TaxID=41978 RepID=UPI0025E0A468|nr:hypothetical protein [Ruminococcus sp.]MBQ8966406.1 hypothetical protein [Ruminococcus sp.]
MSETGKVLAESDDIRLVHEYENAYVIRKSDEKVLAECSFYGDPAGGLIDREERFAVLYGCGISFCGLTEGNSRKYGFDRGCEIWAESAQQLSDGSVEVTAEDGKIFCLDTQGNCKEK